MARSSHTSFISGKRGTVGISEHNFLAGRRRNTMKMNNEARQGNIIYINECLVVSGF